MHYAALATDYDGTIAHDGFVDTPTIAALERLRAVGCKVILVTGRELEDLQRCMPRMDLFDLVVAENGALLFWPATGVELVLADPPPEAFLVRLRAMGVSPLSVGRSIVAMQVPNEALALAAIRELGLDLRIIMNKGSVMVLPDGISKESGLRAALAQLAIPPAATVAVGDAENDLPFLRMCGLGVAVANALPAVKDAASLVTQGARGAGVAELIESWLAGDLAALPETGR
jgi:hydroxymethylpyrimidine pyrophosphatase-like HAD family hydrolase